MEKIGIEHRIGALCQCLLLGLTACQQDAPPTAETPQDGEKENSKRGTIKVKKPIDTKKMIQPTYVLVSLLQEFHFIHNANCENIPATRWRKSILFSK